MAIFVNLTAHSLTNEQKKAATNDFKITDFIEYREVLPELYNEMANSPADSEELEKLAVKVINSMSEMVAQTQSIYFHLPIGSPAFNYVFAGLMGKLAQFKGKILFSHSERVSKEVALPDGSVKKENVFLFKKFIKF